MSTSQRINSKRLVLEGLTPTHADVLFAGLCDERLFEFIDDHPPASVDALRAKYQRLESGASPDGREVWLNWAVRLLDHGPYIGFVQATISEDRSAASAYLLFRDFWGQGYACEGVTALMSHLREVHVVTVFRATVDPRNHRSITLLESLGFELIERRTGVVTIRGVLADEWDFIVCVEPRQNC